MSDFKLSLEIGAVGDKEALAKFENLSAAGQQVTQRFAKATGASLDQAIAKWNELGDKAAEAMLRQSVAAEKAAAKTQAAMDRQAQMLGRAEVAAYKMQEAMDAAKVQQFAKSELEAAEGAEHHSLALGRVERSLESFIVETTGANEQVGLLAAAFGHLELGSPVMIGLMAGIFAVIKGYELLTEKTRDAKEEQEKLIAKMAEAANAGNTDAIRAEARRVQFGTPFDKDGKLVANSAFAPGAFEGSLLDLQGKLRSLTDQFYATTNGFTQLAIQKQMIAVKQQLAPLEEMMGRLQAAGVNVASQPGDNAGKLGTVTTTAMSPDALAKVGRAGEAAAKALAEAYQRELARDLSAATKLAVSQMVADAETTYAAQQSIITELVPSRQQIDASIKEVSAQISDAIQNDPFLAAQKAIHELADRVQREFAHVMGDAMASAFDTAFSGKGLKSAFENLIAAALSGLGGLMEAVGAQMIVYGTWVAKFIAHVATFDPIGQIEAGIGMIAAGALLKSIAGSFGHSGNASGGGGGSYGGSSGGLAQIIDRGVIDPGSYSRTNPANIQQRPTVTNNFTVIGTRDAKAQREIAELVNFSVQRGWIGPAGA